MSEMIERVARALAIHQFGSPDAWEDQVPMARAAIETMRDPTKEMLREGNSVTTDGRGASESWPAMIDEALK